MSHLARWSFRSFHHGWEPERVFPMYFERSSSNQVNTGLAQKNIHDSDSTVLRVNAASFVPADASTFPAESHLSIARAPPTPGETGVFPDAPLEISPVMSDDVVVVDVEHGASHTPKNSKEDY